jgi:hypothetical protein
MLLESLIDVSLSVSQVSDGRLSGSLSPAGTELIRGTLLLSGRPPCL